MNSVPNSVDASSADASSPVASEDLAAWMLQIGHVLGHAKRVSLLLTLDAGKRAVKVLQGQVGLSKSSVHRHLDVLKAAGVVAEEVLGFGKGPRTGYGMTPFGEQLLAVLKGLRQYQDLPERPEPDQERGLRVSSPGRSVPLRYESVCLLLVQVADFYQWQLVHDLMDVDRYRVRMQRLKALAKEVPIDLQALLASEEHAPPVSPTRARQRR